MPGKLGRTSKERNALLRNQASQLLWYGKIETTAPKAKELQSYVEKLITKAEVLRELRHALQAQDCVAFLHLAHPGHYLKISKKCHPITQNKLPRL